MEDKVIIIRRFDNPVEANIIKGLLEANGIPSFLSDEYSLGLNPLFNPATGGVKLKIFERDRERVEKILTQNLAIQEDEESAPN